MSENPFSNDGKSKLENLISLSEAYIKKLPRGDFQANPDFFEAKTEQVLHQNENSFQYQESGFSQNQFRNENNNSSIQNQDDSIEKIAAEVAACKKCVLCEKRTNVVPGMGVKNPLVMIIGEGPGFEEDKQGLPFVGPAGQLLDKMLGAINLSRETNCFIANVVKCRPPQNRDPNPEEGKACRGFLDRQISILKPKMILLLGRIATYHILDTAQGISSIHGQFFEYKTDFATIPVMPIYHPSAVLRNEALKRPVWEDLKVFKKKLEEI
jgi:DNA polymerase